MLPRRNTSNLSPDNRTADRSPATAATRLQALLDDLATRFQRITGYEATVSEPWHDRSARNRIIRRWADQPACRPHRQTVACRRARLTHMRGLGPHRVPPHALSHTCPFGNVCCIFYLYEHRELLGICKIAFPESTSLSRIQSSLEILEILFENLRLKTGTRQQAPAPFALKPFEDLGVSPSQEESRIGARGPSADINYPQNQADHRNKTRLEQLAATNLDTDQLHPQVRHAVELIRRDFRDPDLNVEAVAGRVGSSSAYLSHLFVTQIGCRMRRFILDYRLKEAQHLLRNNKLLVKDVAIACGFLNTDWFSHVFHLETGVSPTEYRRTWRRIHVAP